MCVWEKARERVSEWVYVTNSEWMKLHDLMHLRFIFFFSQVVSIQPTSIEFIFVYVLPHYYEKIFEKLSKSKETLPKKSANSAQNVQCIQMWHFQSKIVFVRNFFANNSLFLFSWHQVEMFGAKLQSNRTYDNVIWLELKWYL